MTYVKPFSTGKSINRILGIGLLGSPVLRNPNEICALDDAAKVTHTKSAKPSTKPESIKARAGIVCQTRASKKVGRIDCSLGGAREPISIRD